MLKSLGSVLALALLGGEVANGAVARRDEAKVGFDYAIDNEALKTFIDNEWETSGLPSLMEFIKIECLSPGYDPEWAANGKLMDALTLFKNYADKAGIVGLKSTIYDHLQNEATNKTAPPLLIIDIGATPGNTDTSFLYGHADKQPLMADKWTKTQPLVPLIDGNYLYGRGSADDGYAMYASVIAVKALQQQKLEHPRVVIFIEAEEESGSENLMLYLNFMRDELKIVPSFMGIFDSGGLSDNSVLWEVTSMRGVVPGTLRVEIVEKGLHSGNAGGVVPTPLRIAEDIITSRIENPETGNIFAPPLDLEVTDRRKQEAYALAETLGKSFYEGYGFVEGATPNHDGSEPTTQDIADAIIRLTQTAQMSVLGISYETVPDVGKGGNVIAPWIAMDLSFRTAPGTNEIKAAEELKALIEKDPPYGANVTFTLGETAPNFLAPVPKPWLDFTLGEAATAMYGKPRMAAGRGGTVPMMSYFSDVFVGVDFDILATGVLIPSTGHHGPDERLEIDTVKKITGVVSYILASQARKTTFVAPPASESALAPAPAPTEAATTIPAAAQAESSESVAVAEPTSTSSSTGIPWWGIVIGCAVGVLAGAAVGVVVTRYKMRKQASSSESTMSLR